jgi:hypothetical protein
MADQLYLSCWLHGFTEQNMLRRFERMLGLFPFSRLTKSHAVFRIIAVDFGESPVFEHSYPQPIDIGAILTAAKEFENPDCCYCLEAWWDLWQYDSEWKLQPSRVALCCFGPEFARDLGEDLRIEFGIDALFLPQPELPNAVRMAQSNIKSLLKLVHDLDDALNPDRRQLWSESGENFSDRLQRALEMAV